MSMSRLQQGHGCGWVGRLSSTPGRFGHLSAGRRLLGWRAASSRLGALIQSNGATWKVLGGHQCGSTLCNNLSNLTLFAGRSRRRRSGVGRWGRQTTSRKWRSKKLSAFLSMQALGGRWCWTYRGRRRGARRVFPCAVRVGRGASWKENRLLRHTRSRARTSPATVSRSSRGGRQHAGSGRSTTACCGVAA